MFQDRKNGQEEEKLIRKINQHNNRDINMHNIVKRVEY
jgi:hypothetical protein